MERPKKIQSLNEVSNDILLMKFESNETLNDILEKFYTIMRKNGIRKYQLAGPVGVEYGMTQNAEWTICYSLLVSQIQSHFTMMDLFTTLPEDLEHY